MKKIILYLMAFILVNVGIGYGVQYTVLYLDLAQTITAQHTFNPSTATTAPFIIGSNAAEVEVADLYAEKATRFASDPSNCLVADTYPAGVDASGNAESCTTATPTDTDFIPYPTSGRVTYCLHAGSTSIPCFGDVLVHLNGSAAVPPTDTAPSTIGFTTTANNNLWGLQGNLIYRANPFSYTFQMGVFMNQITSAKRLWFGLTNKLATEMAASDTPTGDYASFRYTGTSDTTFKCGTGDGVGVTIKDSGVPVDTNFHVFEIRYDEADNQILFYIDESVVCTHTTADNLPGSISHANMRINMRGINLTGGGTATGFSIGYVFLVIDK